MYEEHAGEQFLKTTGILMILCGGISLILTALGLLGVGFLDADISTATTILERMYVIALAVIVFSSLLWIANGILGILFCNNNEKAYINLIVIGFGLFFTLASVALAICSRGITWLNMIGLVIGLILCGYFIYGAILNFKGRKIDAEAKANKKALKEEKKRNKALLKNNKQKKPNVTA